MAYRKKTLRAMSPTARKVARLTGELESVARRLKNLNPHLQSLDHEAGALEAAKDTTRQGEYQAYSDTLAFILSYERIEDAPPLELVAWLRARINEKQS